MGVSVWARVGVVLVLMTHCAESRDARDGKSDPVGTDAAHDGDAGLDQRRDAGAGTHAGPCRSFDEVRLGADACDGLVCTGLPSTDQSNGPRCYPTCETDIDCDDTEDERCDWGLCIPRGSADLCSTDLLTVEERAQTPRPDRNIEQLALTLTDHAVAEQSTYERLDRDIALIRDLEPAVRNIGYYNVHGDELTLFTSTDLVDEMEHGRYTAWNCLNRILGASGFRYRVTDERGTASVSFSRIYDLDQLAERYRCLPEVESAVAEGAEGDDSTICVVPDGDAWHYVFDEASGDCPAGCTEHVFRYFRVDDDGSITVEEPWIDLEDQMSDEPEWTSLFADFGYRATAWRFCDRVLDDERATESECPAGQEDPSSGASTNVDAGATSVDVVALEPRYGPFLTDVVQITAGTRTVCATLDDGTVACWGADHADEQRIRPEIVDGVTDVVQTAIAYLTTCGLTEQGTVVCWGQAPDGGTEPRIYEYSPPTPVPDLADVRKITGRWQHFCVLTEDDRVGCFGYENPFAAPSSAAFGSVLWLDHLQGVRDIAATFDLGCELLVAFQDGHAECIDAMQEEGEVFLDRRLLDVDDVTQVSDVCMTANDAAYCVEGPPNRDAVRISGLDDVLMATAGENHACAVTTAGELWCWDGNQSGQLGIDSRSAEELLPARVPLVQRVEEVTAGDRFTCARLETGHVACWGVGQLGDGTLNGALLPTPVHLAR